jgi:AraC-like DNA-binding protein
VKRNPLTLESYRPRQPFLQKLLPAYVEGGHAASTLFGGGIQFTGFRLDTENADKMFVFPDGCLYLVICCYPPKPSANICGSLIHRKQGFFVRSDCDYFSIRFLPGYVEPFFKLPANEFTEYEIPAQAVLPHAEELLEQVAAAVSFEGRVQAFLDFYLRYYPGKLSVPDLVRYAAGRIIQSRGAAQIGDLAADSGYSTRYLLSLFQRYMGVPPKLFSRIIRFQFALDELSHYGEDGSLGSILDLGYFDQNHFIKEFKEFGTDTPKKYLRLFPASTDDRGLQNSEGGSQPYSYRLNGIGAGWLRLQGQR